LLKAHKHLVQETGIKFQVIICQPKAYADKVALYSEDTPNKFDGFDEFLSSEQATEFDSANHIFGEGTFAEVLAQSKKHAAKEGWIMVDQHYDDSSLTGHASTAGELMAACPNLTDVVCGTGTGATAAGLRRFLPDWVQVHSRPTTSGDIDGLCDVRRYNNFCNTTLLEGYDNPTFNPSEAKMGVSELSSFGITCGPSSGASYSLAQEIKQSRPNAQVAFICADGKLPSDSLTMASWNWSRVEASM
jgi:hypothetical protein